MISSLPHKANGGNLRPRELKAVPTNENATPKSSVPHKQMDKKTPAGFRSVQNPRTATTRELENRVVAAKALVFHSPKKLVNLKRSVELSSSVKKLCNGMMRKLETGNKRNVTSTPSKKSLRRAKEKEQHVLSSNPSKVYEANNGMELENQSGSSEKTSGDEEFLAMTIVDNCFNGKTISATSRVKYTKPKLTNPKPFRLRTDERRILKESNMEKKPQVSLAKEEETTNILGFHGEILGPKHEPARLEKNTTSRSKSLRGTSTTTLVRHDASEDMVNCKR
uniref:Uncharacterized protein n=1 Tax=Brassica oleracea TaxID=3712 RepID=A0A3P6G6R2_BRAOL|nr:unnamed protein product [Brassica oleracea]